MILVKRSISDISLDKTLCISSPDLLTTVIILVYHFALMHSEQDLQIKMLNLILSLQMSAHYFTMLFSLYF